MEPFKIQDCALIVRMGGLEPAMNLRELRDRLAICPSDSLYHHFCETLLRPSFDDPEYLNDFAVWASRYLLDRPLAEQFGVIDPYDFGNLEDLRATMIEIIDNRLSELSHVPWTHRGHEFFFMRAVTVVFDTGRKIADLSQFVAAAAAMTRGSIYYHFIEARRRTENHLDDFTIWLSRCEDERCAELERALAEVDFYFLGLQDLQREIVRVSSEFLSRGAR